MNITAMIYTRGHNAESIAKQIARCEYYAELAGYEVIGYVDGSEMFDAIGNIDVLLVSEPSRLSRSAEEFHSIIDALEADGIRLEIANRENITDILALQTLERIRKEMANR